MKGIGWLVALWLMGQSRNARAPSSPAPIMTGRVPSGLPLPAQHGFSADYLLNDQNFQPAGHGPDPDEQAWKRYALDSQRPGPRVQDDARPGFRKLNAFERWALEPYFIDEDLTATIYNGVLPPIIDRSKLPPGIDLDNLPVTAHAMTFGTPGGGSPPMIWLVHFRPQLWRRWDLSLLAHELSHGAQVRMGGLTPAELLALMTRYGYEGSPTEVQARWMQGAVLSKLDSRARAFYAST